MAKKKATRPVHPGSELVVVKDLKTKKQREMSKNAFELIKDNRMPENKNIKRYSLVDVKVENTPEKLIAQINESFSSAEVSRLSKLSEDDKVKKAAEERAAEIKKMEADSTDEDCPSGNCN